MRIIIISNAAARRLQALGESDHFFIITKAHGPPVCLMQQTNSRRACDRALLLATEGDKGKACVSGRTKQREAPSTQDRRTGQDDSRNGRQEHAVTQ